MRLAADFVRVTCREVTAIECCVDPAPPWSGLLGRDVSLFAFSTNESLFGVTNEVRSKGLALVPRVQVLIDASLNYVLCRVLLWPPRPATTDEGSLLYVWMGLGLLVRFFTILSHTSPTW